MEDKITTLQDGVIVLFQNKELVGIIRHDTVTKTRVIYRCEPMATEEIVDLITHKGIAIKGKKEDK